MSIPRTTKFTLKRIVEGIKDGTIPDNGFGKEVEKLSPEKKRQLIDMASKWENFGECLRNEESLMNSAKGITELSELAETYALNECPDAFQRNIVERDMKEIKKRVVEFQKITKEAYARMQQLGVAYQDIGHILGRYYNLKNNLPPQTLQSEMMPYAQQSSAGQFDPRSFAVNEGEGVIYKDRQGGQWVYWMNNTDTGGHITIKPESVAKYIRQGYHIVELERDPRRQPDPDLSHYMGDGDRS